MLSKYTEVWFVSEVTTWNQVTAKSTASRMRNAASGLRSCVDVHAFALLLDGLLNMHIPSMEWCKANNPEII
jgi:hypothetical protein